MLRVVIFTRLDNTLTNTGVVILTRVDNSVTNIDKFLYYDISMSIYLALEVDS